MMLNLKMISDYSEEENIFTKYAKAKKAGNIAEAERLSKIIENNARLAKLYCKKERTEKEEINLTKQCAICGKPIRNDLTFCSSFCIREYRARNGR
jgi:hypothetical protein